MYIPFSVRGPLLSYLNLSSDRQPHLVSNDPINKPLVYLMYDLSFFIHCIILLEPDLVLPGTYSSTPFKQQLSSLILGHLQNLYLLYTNLELKFSSQTFLTYLPVLSVSVPVRYFHRYSSQYKFS